MAPGGLLINAGYTYRSRVASADDGLTLAEHLSRRFRHSTRDEWLARIRARRLRVEGRVASPQTVLRAGQWVSWQRPGWREPQVPTEVAVLYDDGQLVALAKPAGLPTLPGAGFLDGTLLGVIRRQIDRHARPLHRLGRWTSGLVLCGRTPQARSDLSQQWREGRVVKRYRALARGRPRDADFDIDVPIGRIAYAPLGHLWAANGAGKPACTRVRVLEQRDEEFVADVTILSGRPHQIRIHLAAAGHPLRGDPLYAAGGVPAADCTALPGDPGYTLHAERLVFDHPLDGRRVSLRCPPPAQLCIRDEFRSRGSAACSSDPAPA